MINDLRTFFVTNEVVVLSVCGQVFFVLGLAIALQSRRYSRLELARSLPFLAAFGISHGLHEWGLIFIPIQATYLSELYVRMLQVAQVLLVALSFACLFQFGMALLAPTGRRLWLKALPALVLLGWTLGPFVIGLSLASDLATWQRNAAIWAGYILGFPGSLVAAYGLRRYTLECIAPLRLPHIVRTLRIAGLALGAYAVVGGLVGPPGSFFPATWLNEEVLLRALGVPVEVLRSLVGLVLTVAMIRALEVFEVELDQRIGAMQYAQSLANERERIGRELHDHTMQSVYAAGLLVEKARRWLGNSHPTAVSLDRSMGVLADALVNMRRYILDLQSSPEEVDVATGLQRLIREFCLNALVDVTLDMTLDSAPPLSPERVCQVLAVANEALSNVLKHARARSVIVQAHREDDWLDLVIADDGVGLPPNPRMGYGLRTMRERVRLLGGG
ncbi:sensor histidine kinase [Candidatus Hakubella thermalkaliphila]|uniref:Signal transduction histidine kinase subgroup 3 dimerisation and phosphoacceptor domain-containing protein n=2 Tax=Candidatus Hakubella thermalkaliphila TaxID=2754717 RepID=A0A6V8Q4D7_9ACTN|nr:histidine kinase [Candidatus Hakubella thermalkaliphila]GFP39625.1 hypothetical protein HKBW3S47_01323 [Candidatus Hakubella thermalkaliphila]GFP41903.1 hypothetical protein HKBW3C_01030 [Candidatus Hakubella thermalkaliphila]